MAPKPPTFHQIAHILLLTGLLLCTTVRNSRAQNIDSLQMTMESIKAQIEKQGAIKSAAGTKSGWVFEYEGCACYYRKNQSYSAGSYALIEWEIQFDLGDMRTAEISPFDDRAILLETAGGERLAKTIQHKMYRDDELEVTSVQEKRVVIDISNRTSAPKLIDSFNRAIEMCQKLE